jgi:hypothetical protein
MWEQLRRFSALERPARGIFLRASLLLPLLSFALRLRGLQKTQDFLRKFLPVSAATKSSATFERALLTVRMVRAAARRGFRQTTCLEESLALWWLLGRQGTASDLRIGVRRDAERFEAHAWIEYEGKALNEPQAQHQHYAAFDSAFSAPPEER